MAGKGGAWKVAYADFVTAMMALFMVLWISSQDKEVLIATSRYFQNPFNSPMDAASGILPDDNTKASSRPSGESTGNQSNESSNREIDLQFLNSVAKEFFRMMQMDQDLADKPIDIQVTSDGLRITLYDRARRPLFAEKSAEFTEWGRFAMQSLAWLIDRNRFHVVIEGHTRKGLELPQPDYTPWELSSDRANASRRALTHYAVDPAQIDRVTGYADTRPIPFQSADAESNQRVTLSLSVVRSKPKAETAAEASKNNPKDAAPKNGGGPTAVPRKSPPAAALNAPAEPARVAGTP